MGGLNIDETTAITEAIENASAALVAAYESWSREAQRVVTDATRNDGQDATFADYANNAARLYLGWMTGLSMLGSTYLDNMALISGDEPTFWWTSELRPLPAGVTTNAGELLEVMAAEEWPSATPFVDPVGVYIYGSADEPLSASQGGTGIPAAWDRRVRFLFKKEGGYVPGTVSVVVQSPDGSSAEMLVVLAPSDGPVS